MQLSDVPAGCRALRCDTCGDHLAIPTDGTDDEVQARAAEAMTEHRVICPGPLAEPEPVAELGHGTLREQVAAAVADPTWCPATYSHHCGHWKAGGECCACYETRPEGL